MTNAKLVHLNWSQVTIILLILCRLSSANVSLAVELGAKLNFSISQDTPDSIENAFNFIGTSRLNGQVVALIEDIENSNQELFSVGTNVFGLGTLTAVNEKSITIKSSSFIVRLFLQGGTTKDLIKTNYIKESGHENSTSSRNTSNLPMEKSSYFKLGETDLKNEINSMKLPLMDSKLVPTTTQLHSGVTFSKEALGASPCSFGLEQGDIITGINGVDLSSIWNDIGVASSLNLKDLLEGSIISDQVGPKGGLNSEWVRFQVVKSKDKHHETLKLKLVDGLFAYAWEKPSA